MQLKVSWYLVPAAINKVNIKLLIIGKCWYVGIRDYRRVLDEQVDAVPKIDEQQLHLGNATAHKQHILTVQESDLKLCISIVMHESGL